MKHTLAIPAEATGERADKFVAQALPDYSRSFWQKQFSAGHILLGDAPLKASSILEAGELTITIPEQAITLPDIPILYQDDDVMVIDKPAGILTHAKGVAAEEATVADFIRPFTSDAPDSNRPGIVHRLDRDTSGVLILAKTAEAKHWLQKQFAERNVKKVYLALVEGKLEPPEAILRLPLERNPKQPQKFRVGAGGKPAETAYKVQQYLPHHTLVELHPLTGRTHQLRVHMAYLQHPILGDRFYSTTTGPLFLHAQSLEITLPNHQRRTFTAPLPPALVNLLEAKE